MNNRIYGSFWQVALALLTIYLVWGSTYLAIRVVVREWPPFFMAGTRFLLAALLMLPFSLRRPGWKQLSRAQIRNAAIIGVLLLLGGNGGVVWAEQFVESGLASVVVATTILWIALFEHFSGRGERLTLGLLLSIAVGLCGVAILTVKPDEVLWKSGELQGYAVLFLAPVLWAAGTVYGHHADAPRDTIVNTILQMLFGGAALMIAAAFGREWNRFGEIEAFSASTGAWAYLVVIGSCLAFSAYAWLVRNARPTLIATYAFVNPVVALFLGWFFLSEAITSRILLGSALVIGSVLWIQLRKALLTRAPSPTMKSS